MDITFFQGGNSPHLPAYWSGRLLQKAPRPPRLPGAAGDSRLSRWDLWYPAFCGGVASVFLCLFTLGPALSRPAPVLEAPVAVEAASPAPAVPVPDIPVVAGPSPLTTVQKRADTVQEAWRDIGRRDQTLAFFAEIVQSEYLAHCILVNADAFDVSPALAFALCWQESRFKPRAVNSSNRDRSIDRGLFQLNNKSFPGLEEEQFFDPWINSWYGLSHLRLCLDRGGSVVSALAMYNAGTARVNGDGTPRQTLEYVARILETRDAITRLHDERGVPAAMPEPEPPAGINADAPRLARLHPVLRQDRKP